MISSNYCEDNIAPTLGVVLFIVLVTAKSVSGIGTGVTVAELFPDTMSLCVPEIVAVLP